MGFTSYGPGDLETCGPCDDHPLDPRTEEPQADAFSDWHADCFLQEFAASAGSAEEWLRSVGCDGLGDADGDGQVNELLRALSADSAAGKSFSGGEVHWRIIRKLALQAFKSDEWK
jgi:hypothetical protein